MQSTNRNDHPHQEAIDALIIEVNKFRKDEHKIIISMDGNETLMSAAGGGGVFFLQNV